MSDVSGTNPDQPDAADEPLIPPADVVIPPPPPEIPIPDGLLTPPPEPEIASADAVIPPPPPETLRRSDRPRPTPALLDAEPPPAVAEDWAKPSVAPEVPTSGGYRGLTVAIFAFLFVLLVAAIVTGAYLLNTGRFPFVVFDDATAGPLSFMLLF
jgi:hypothetical protein